VISVKPQHGGHGNGFFRRSAINLKLSLLARFPLKNLWHLRQNLGKQRHEAKRAFPSVALPQQANYGAAFPATEKKAKPKGANPWALQKARGREQGREGHARKARESRSGFLQKNSGGLRRNAVLCLRRLALGFSFRACQARTSTIYFCARRRLRLMKFSSSPGASDSAPGRSSISIMLLAFFNLRSANAP